MVRYCSVVGCKSNDDSTSFTYVVCNKLCQRQSKLNANLQKNDVGFFKKIDLTTAVTINDFKFRNYLVDSENFSGNSLTGIPNMSIANTLDFNFHKNIGLFFQHQFNSKTSLNDAETVFAKSYNLLDAKLNWQRNFRNYYLTFNFGINNILNTNYSLGNDLNAFGGRYFNIAAKRNFVIGLNIRLLK